MSLQFKLTPGLWPRTSGSSSAAPNLDCGLIHFHMNCLSVHLGHASQDNNSGACSV